ncbi:cell division protein FtsL [Thiopseudomonas alkaliphila]|uniref:Cell division protein FtsL n=1 Tax=Thiopseudomonas alkaliphila TaxID=1697053 RepID=A0AAW7DUU6_9GAMM|nr:cell division protein FtsL [Thiopseudomonas alkaliphila]MDM1696461.1 cell division protein FtsL [Thiopseudomonas alkaliphila]MDM1707137.1 cell division protein FtsL [Thiopseudomonas alkaliphila]
MIKPSPQSSRGPANGGALFTRRLPLLAFPILLTFLFVMGTAVSIAQKSHESRKLVKALYDEMKIKDEAQAEWGRLVLEQTTWTAHNRIEALAITDLKMRTPEPGEVIMVK